MTNGTHLELHVGEAFAKTVKPTPELGSLDSFRRTSRYNRDSDDKELYRSIYINKNHSPDQLKALLKLLNDAPKTDNITQPAIRSLKRHLAAFEDEGKGSPFTWLSLAAGLRHYLFSSKHKWLISTRESDCGIMYLPLDIKIEANDSRREKDAPTVYLDLVFNSHRGYVSTRQHVRISAGTLQSRSIAQHLAEQNLRVATDEDMELYEQLQERYKLYRSKDQSQVWVRDFAAETANDSWWWSSKDINLTVKGKPSKAVLDLKGDPNSYSYSYSRRNRSREEGLAKQIKTITNADWLAPELVEEKFTLPVPHHPLLPIFSLAHHESYWVNVKNMQFYKYDETLQDKLVLPDANIKLLDALVQNLDLFVEEDESRSRVLTDKAQSRVILFKGPPGVGKTLTSEVYAERINRPLYEVACGQLGSDPEELETKLQMVLSRSVRLNMPLVLNEADVYVKARGDNLSQNSIITVFLRLLEYHTGLVFLTTNRPDDIDFALISRCIAVINCERPKEPERIRLWRVLSQEFDKQMPEEHAKKAAKLFPEVSGRDIQQLLMLTRRVCIAHGESISLRALADNAIFRDIKVDSDYYATCFAKDKQ